MSFYSSHETPLAIQLSEPCMRHLSLHAQSLLAPITHILNFIRVYSQSDPARVGAPLGLGPQEPPTNQCIGPNSTQKN